MRQNSGYRTEPLSFNRRAVIASTSVTREKSTVHCLAEVDVTVPRRIMVDHEARTGERPSMTAYVAACLARTLKDHPRLNAFIKGGRLILLEDVTVSVLVEREIGGERVPEPLGIQRAQEKSFWQIHREIREAAKRTEGKLGSLAGMEWVRFVPSFLLRAFVRIADGNIRMAMRYGKAAVTSVGMFGGGSARWFIPHGSATVLVTVGGISETAVRTGDGSTARERLCLTVSFDHDVVDGAPAARFMKQFSGLLEDGNLLREGKGD